MPAPTPAKAYGILVGSSSESEEADLSNLTRYAIAAAVGAVALLLTPRIARVARSPAKSAIKSGLRAAMSLRVKTAEVLEAAEDFVAEVKHELFEEIAAELQENAASVQETPAAPQSDVGRNAEMTRAA